MKHELISADNGQKTWIVVLDEGDEVSKCLLDFASEKHLKDAHFTAIGAFQRSVIGYFEWDKREYRRNVFERQLEVVSLIGDVALQDGKPKLHMHAVLGADNGNALGGHLLEGHVRPTLEVVLTESPARLHRVYDARAGVALIKLGVNAPDDQLPESPVA